MKRMVSYLEEDRPSQILQDKPCPKQPKDISHYSENRMCDCHHRHMSPTSPTQMSAASFSTTSKDDYHLTSSNQIKYSISSRTERKLDSNPPNDAKYPRVSSNELPYCTSHQRDYKYRSIPANDVKYGPPSPTVDDNYHVIHSSPHSSLSTSPVMNYKNNEIENIEIENYSLRNRCKRLEAIVTQLIESKEKSNISEINRDSYEIVNRKSPNSVIIPSSYHRKISDSSKSLSPVYHQVQNDIPYSDITHNKLSLSGRPSKRSNHYNAYHPSQKDGETIDRESNPFDDAYKAARLYDKSRESLINADEMEKQNEIFRMNYYHKTHGKSRNNTWQNKLKNTPFKPYQTKPDIMHKKHSVSHEKSSYGIPYEDIIDRPIRCNNKDDTGHFYIKQKCYPSTISSSQSTVKYGDSSKFISDPKVNHFNSDFYTKLPPKLHIVESQNKSGVTLTWNATSNCDSSLVKSYQLFARELFGYKVGTMKRIGIISASPLPMSCKVEKLRYNIKYKFAVCAVDIYGRFGKMSNFTGKFELKSENNEDGKPAGKDDEELRIILT